MNPLKDMSLIEKLIAGVILWSVFCASSLVLVHAYLALKNDGAQVNKITIGTTNSTKKK